MVGALTQERNVSAPQLLQQKTGNVWPPCSISNINFIFHLETFRRRISSEEYIASIFRLEELAKQEISRIRQHVEIPPKHTKT
jgi:hypothetical protein